MNLEGTILLILLYVYVLREQTKTVSIFKIERGLLMLDTTKY